MKPVDREPFKKNCGRLFHGVALSLTLTLSRWERAKLLDAFLKFVSTTAEFSRGLAKTRGVFLPLPAGAATAAMAGEGEGRPSQDGYSFS